MLLQFSGSVKQGFNALGPRHSVAFEKGECDALRQGALHRASLHIALYTAAH